MENTTSFPRRREAILFILFINFFLFGCAKAPQEIKDSAPKHPLSHSALDKIPDAVPKHEPLSRYGNRFGKNGKSNSYVALKKRYTVMPTSKNYKARGMASWYGTKFQGRKTSSGECYNMYAMTAAHPTLPLPTYAKVTNLQNGKSVIVKVNDRGPFHSKRLIDLSYVAAHKLGMLGKGTAHVEVQSIDPRDHGRNMHHGPARGPAPTIKESLYLQLGAFNNQANAETFSKKVGKVSKLPVKISQQKGKHASVFKVWMGPLKDYQEVTRLNERLSKADIPSPVVMNKAP